jgi:hypothetical protein
MHTADEQREKQQLAGDRSPLNGCARSAAFDQSQLLVFCFVVLRFGSERFTLPSQALTFKQSRIENLKPRARRKHSIEPG